MMEQTAIGMVNIEENKGVNSKKEIILTVALSVSILIAIAIPGLSSIFKYIIIPFILIALYNTDSFEYLLFMFCFLDDPLGTYVMGRITLIWFYLAFLAYRWLASNKKIVIKKDRFVPLMIIFTYLVISCFDYSFRSFKMMLVVFIFYQISEDIQDNPDKLERLFKVVIISSLICAVGLAFNLLGESYEPRSEGIGFSDPNYASFVCLIGLCATMNYKHKSKLTKIVFIFFDVFFTFAIFRSGSRTGLITTVLILLLHIFMGKGMSNKLKRTLLASIIAITFLLFVFKNINLPFVDTLVNRWQDTYLMLTMGNITKATASRNVIFSLYLNYFNKQNIFSKLFGGNVVGSSALLSIARGYVSHNVYMDYLLAFGIIGTIVMLYHGLKRIWSYYKKYRISGEAVYATAVEIKIMALVFGFTLAMLEVKLWWVIFFL